MTIELRQYVPGDEKLIEPVEDTLRTHPDYESEWNRLVRPEWTWTGWFGNRLLGLGGIIPYEDNGYVWLMIDKHTTQKFKLARAMKDILRFGESYGFKYLWSYVQTKFKDGCKLARFLGFERGEQVGNCYKYIKRSQICPTP